ncbi:hypothetical protein TcarDRAFT_0030 [Thermosinus carboxydivorans Nor1]|uniref:THIF-type NAD/FAD binding fold domain-containing protein n=1 Tax=Thermosinus carboxydivorans Nor1 TaxID=401526 RepID=A1HU86_9FIRM|nr:hypothetical protein TcarDRAFT_0030 [Thermosinus carboxydivorans Nor1]
MPQALSPFSASGGVGSYAVEALARSGIGHLVLIDHDKGKHNEY